MFGTAQVSSSSFFAARRESSTFSLGGHGSAPSSTGITSSVASLPVAHHVASLSATPLPAAVLVAAAGDRFVTLVTARRTDDPSAANGGNPLRSTGSASTRPLTLSAATTLPLVTVASASAVTASPFTASASRTTGAKGGNVLNSALVVAAGELGTFDVFEVNAAACATDASLSPEVHLVCSGDVSRVAPQDSPFASAAQHYSLSPHERRVVAATSAWCASIGTAWVALATANRLVIFDVLALCAGDCRRALSVIDSDSCPSFAGSHGGASIVNVTPLLRHSHRAPAPLSSAVSNASSSEADDDSSTVAPDRSGAFEEASFSVIWDDGTVHTVFSIIGEIQAGFQRVAFTAVRSVVPSLWLGDDDAMVAAAGASVRPGRGGARHRTVIATPDGQIALASYSATLDHGDMDAFTTPVSALPEMKRLKALCSPSRLCVVDGRATSSAERAAGATAFVVSSGVDLLTTSWDQSSIGGGVRPLKNIGTFVTPITALTTLPPLPSATLDRGGVKGTATPGSMRSSQTNVTMGRLGTLDGPVAVAAADAALHFTML